MLVEFTNEALFVGLHWGNFNKLYFKHTDDEPDRHKGPELLLYESPTAEHESLKNPMPGQVLWLPYYNPDAFPSRKPAERSLLQRWFIYRAWEYLKVEELSEIEENQFADGNDHRWNSWVEEAHVLRERLARCKLI